MKVTAICSRSEGWWAVEVPEIRGLHTQARSLGRVEAMVLDAASALLDRPESEFEVALSVNLPQRLAERVQRSAELSQAARTAQALASESMRKAAADLADFGLPLRDVGSLLGVSFQRVGQLLKESDPVDPRPADHIGTTSASR